MSASFAMADRSVSDICEKIIQQHHTDLDSAEVKIDLLLAFRDPDGEAPAILKDGQRVWGAVKTIGLKDRVKGMGDCEIILDGDAWADMSGLTKVALLDHYLEHFEVKRDKNGDFIFDDINRPVIKMRPHDRIIRLFHSVSRRHGRESIEAIQLKSMFVSNPDLLEAVPNSREEKRAELDAAAKDLMETMDASKPTMKISVDGAEPVEMTREQFQASISKKLKDVKEGK